MNRALEVEEIYTCEDITEPSVHDHEENAALVVLENLIEVVTFLVVKNDAENSKENGLNYFEDYIQRLSELVQPVSFENG